MALPTRVYVVFKPSGRIARLANGSIFYTRKPHAFKRARAINGYVVAADVPIWTKLFEEKPTLTSLEPASFEY